MMTSTQELVVLANSSVLTSTIYEDFTTSSVVLNEKLEKLNRLNFKRW